ncbi:myosin-12 [Dorcoceras hygrometricum]|uniref:Myosin-12 n=1 Tax=Dorcoceras hygrometricum TaxID=472368 RepID=A0A2Z7A5G8_9LAMI|nr:myosin-12 [Dorcoceras hygrometricum]
MKSQQWISSFGPGPDGPVQVHSLHAAAPYPLSRRGRLAPPPPPPRVAGIRSGRFDEDNPLVQISSVFLVQADEGVSFLVVDRIGDIYRNLPRRADVIVTTVGARHKCQQGSVLNTLAPPPPPPRVAGIRSGRFDEDNPLVQISEHFDVLSMQMDGLPGKLSNCPRSDSPNGYHLSSGESEHNQLPTEDDDVSVYVTQAESRRANTRINEEAPRVGYYTRNQQREFLTHLLVYVPAGLLMHRLVVDDVGATSSFW